MFWLIESSVARQVWTSLCRYWAMFYACGIVALGVNSSLVRACLEAGNKAVVKRSLGSLSVCKWTGKSVKLMWCYVCRVNAYNGLWVAHRIFVVVLPRLCTAEIASGLVRVWTQALGDQPVNAEIRAQVLSCAKKGRLEWPVLVWTLRILVYRIIPCNAYTGTVVFAIDHGRTIACVGVNQ